MSDKYHGFIREICFDSFIKHSFPDVSINSRQCVTEQNNVSFTVKSPETTICTKCVCKDAICEGQFGLLMALIMIARIYSKHLLNEKRKVLGNGEKTLRSSSQHQLRIYVVAISANLCLNLITNVSFCC